jgi:predicted dehydrogenase
MAELKVGIVGCGGRGRGHARHIAGLDGVRLEAACDPAAATRRAVAAEFGIPHQYDEPRQMLATGSLDAVVVSAPPEFNFAAALPCLEAGVDTLVEKPPGLRVAETRQLQEAAARSGARCMVGWNRRFNPLIVEARQRVAERGPLVTIVGEFHKNLAQIEAQGKIAEPVLARFLYETPIHSIDIVRALAGSPVSEVHAVSRSSVSRHRDVFGALIQFENGCVGHLIANMTAGARLERYELHGAGISVYLEGVSRGQVVEDDAVTELTVARDSTLEQDRFFLDCVRDGRPIAAPACDLHGAVATMELAARIFGD